MPTQDLNAPFTGLLSLPDRQPFGTSAPVMLGSGETVAVIGWHRWSIWARFDILDANGTGVLASGRKEGFWGSTFGLVDAAEQPLLQVKFGWMGITGATVTLPTGQQLSAQGNWLGRQFSVTDAAGRSIARLVTTSTIVSLRPDSFALELSIPVLSIIQAAGLAQCIRAALEARRSSSGG